MNEKKPFLKSGDYVFVNNLSSPREIEYFRHGLCRVKLRDVCETPYFENLFYAAGYKRYGVSRYIYVKKRWHYYPALTCEFIRIRIRYAQLFRLVKFIIKRPLNQCRLKNRLRRRVHKKQF